MGVAGPPLVNDSIAPTEGVAGRVDADANRLIGIGLLALRSAPQEQAFNVAVATPTFYVGFLALAVIAPLVSGGGYELYPPGQLVAYPVGPAAVFRGTLVLAPVNLAWLLNVIALFVVTGFASGPITWAATSRSLVVVGVFIATATVAGHVIGWLVVGLRKSRGGRIATNLLGIAAVVAGPRHLLDRERRDSA